MSDISTTLSMNTSSLFSEQELLTCSMFNFKMFLYVLTIIICISFIFSCITSLFAPNKKQLLKYKCENFSNNLFFSDKDTIHQNYSNYQSSSLTSNNYLIFGQANRFIHYDSIISKPTYTLDIFANLYIINGSPFGKNRPKNSNEQYSVYLKNTKTSAKLKIGKLQKDGDGMYKLHFTSTEPNKYIQFNEVEITYYTPEKESVLLNGKFTII